MIEYPLHGYVSLELKKRARWDLNPRSPAPKADTLIRARLRALTLQLNNGVALKDLRQFL